MSKQSQELAMQGKTVLVVSSGGYCQRFIWDVYTEFGIKVYCFIFFIFYGTKATVFVSLASSDVQSVGFSLDTPVLPPLNVGTL